MERAYSFDDEGFAMPPPSPPHLPRHMNNTDLVRGYLDPAIQCMRKTRRPSDLYYGPAVVNADLPSKNPWELPGLAHNKGGMRYTYYLTDHRALAFYNSRALEEIRTDRGIWENKTSDMGIRVGHNGVVGIKKTMKFHQHRVDDAFSGTKINWIMNVHYSCDERNSFIQDGLVLCHVFEADSPDYDDTRKCLGCHGNYWDQAFGAPNPVCDAGNHWDQAFDAPNPVCDAGNHWDQAFGAPSKASFNSTHPGSRPMHHHDTECRSNPVSNSYIAEFGNIMLGDPDPANSAGNHNGQAFGAPSNASFNSTHPGSWPMHHHDTEPRSDPMLTSYIAKLENLLLGDPDNSPGNHSGQAFDASFNSTHPGSRSMHHHDTERCSDPYITELGNLFDPDNSTDTGNCSARSGVDPPMLDHGHSKKRKKCSVVWEYFTKIFAQDEHGKKKEKLTFAICKHCCKILTGSSKGGTTHLINHVCPCKLKPVAAGRNVNVNSSSNQMSS